jgi:branched-subunit amino acid aminotransferase/4-amino-4-deoxychorismate lyase
MTTPLAYLNGDFRPQNEAQLPLHDAGFVWGATVTDLCRTFRHRLFRLADHLDRFRDLQWYLGTRDAHELYAKFGFVPPNERTMVRPRRET